MKKAPRIPRSSEVKPNESNPKHETLHLTLKDTTKEPWFSLVIDEDPEVRKREEYRELKPYWFRRLVFQPHLVCQFFGGYDVKTLDAKQITKMLHTPRFLQMVAFVPYKTVTFRNGYGDHVPEAVIELKKIKIATGNPEWGAEEDALCFVLELGEVLSTKNLKR